jgi:hypothetical protein
MDQVHFLELQIRRDWKVLMQVHTVSSNSRNSNCQSSLFSKKIQLYGFSAYPDCTSPQLVRISGVFLLYIPLYLPYLQPVFSIWNLRTRHVVMTQIHISALEGGGWSAPRPDRFTPGKDPVPIVQETGWTPGLFWTCAKNLAHAGIRSPARPALSQSRSIYHGVKYYK